MLSKVFVVILLGAAPWGGIWFPSTAGIALGLGLPTAIGLSTAGQFGGVFAILGAVSQAEKHPKVAKKLDQIRTERVRYFLNRYGVFGVPVAVVVLGAYAATAALSALGMERRRVVISVSLSLLALAIGMYILIAIVLPN